MAQDGRERGLKLADHGRSDWRIVLLPGASDAERFAAKELQEHMERVGGVKLPIVEAANGAAEGEPGRRAREIRVGHARDMAAAGLLPAAEAELGQEEYIVRVVGAADAESAEGAAIVIAGGRPRGTLYGVYAFLERELGVRWYTPAVTRAPKRDAVVIDGGLNLREKPAFEYRDAYFTESNGEALWAVRNRLNGQHKNIGDDKGGCVRYAGPFVHTFDVLVPVEEYYDEHPEYFSEVGGVRLREQPQLCLTNEDVFRIVLEKVRKWIEDNPGASIVSVSQSDWENPCECANCRAVDEEEGNYSGTLIRFMNRLGEALEKDYPHIAVDTLAYQYTRKPPKTRPRPNVIVRLCSIECCFAHPLESCSEKMLLKKSKGTGATFTEDLIGWGRICDRLYIWDYVTNFANFMLPFPNWDVMQPNLQLFRDNGVKGVFALGSCGIGGGGVVAELRMYVLSKLLWDPDADVSALIDEFLPAVYGPGGGELRKYIDELTRIASDPHIHASIYDRPDAGYVTPELLDLADACFDRAEAAAKDDAEALARLRRLRLSIRYTRLQFVPVGAPGRDEAIDEFLKDLEREGIKQVAEHIPARTTMERLRAGVWFSHFARYEDGWNPFDEAKLEI